MSTYKVIELVGSSYTSWADAAKTALETAGKTLRDLRVAEVTRMDVRVENEGKIMDNGFASPSTLSPLSSSHRPSRFTTRCVIWPTFLPQPVQRGGSSLLPVLRQDK